MDSPYGIKKEEAVEYFFISTPDEEITVATTFDKYSRDTNLTEIHRQHIKEEPAELCLYTSNNPKNDPDFELCEDSQDEKQSEDDSDEDWSIQKERKRAKGKSRVKPKLKYPHKFHKISTDFLTSNGPPYDCTICSLTFPDEKTLRVHHGIHKGKSFQCDICSKVFRKKTHIYEHMKVHGEQQYSCPVCEKSFAIKKSWINHQIVHEEKKFECDICHARFRQKGHIWEHMKVHRERTRKYKCELCDMSYYEQRTLTRHMRLAHTKTPRKRFRCPNALCDKSYSSVSSFKMHACIDGKRPESLFKARCPECGKWFYNKFEMSRHAKRIHINKVENSVCHKCNRIFMPRHWDKCVLHMIQNCAYPVVYKCDKCLQVLSSKPKIIEHFADKHGVVSDLMNLPCPHCNKKFMLQYKLNFHLKKSHHNKLWNCAYCGKIYRSASGCGVHEKRCVSKKISDKYSKQINDSDQTSKTNECNISNRSVIKPINSIEHKEDDHSEKKFELNEKSTTLPKSKIHNKDVGAFECRNCKKQFIGENLYKKHLKSDTCVDANKHENGTHKHQCTICSKLYSRSGYLKIHIAKMHSQDRVYYKCELCRKKFSAIGSLQRHIEIGDHRDTFQCEVCLKNFQRIGAYKTHKTYCKLKIQSNEGELILS